MCRYAVEAMYQEKPKRLNYNLEPGDEEVLIYQCVCNGLSIDPVSLINKSTMNVQT